MSDKLADRHLARVAYVYVRQSSPHQVLHHREGQRRQYALADHARSLGFGEVVVIDEDLGRSGSGSVERRGFARLLEAVCGSEVGAVFALEASRLARNNRDWHHLIDLCALTDTLVVDYDGTYDPRRLNDRLLLGLKGTMSEFELGLLRQRAREAMRQMVERGEVLTGVPVGYERTADNRCEMTPDRQVQEAIRSVFAKFEELGSARQVCLWCREEGMLLPNRQNGRNAEVFWRPAVYRRILSMLKNPIYAGTFAYGRTRTKTTLVEGRARKQTGFAVPQAEWQVVLHDHHPGYICWPQFLRNQEQLASNVAMQGRMNRGAAKDGPALLAGLLRCSRCGRKLHVRYSGVTGRVPRYLCRRGGDVHPSGGSCISFGGLRVDAAVAEVVLEALAPMGIEAALAAWDTRSRAGAEKRRALGLAFEKAEYEASRAQRQYDAVDPENRLVAGELEARWNVALKQVEELQRRLAEHDAMQEMPSEDERERLLALGEDLHAIWEHPEAPTPLKKRILRTVFEEVVADVDEEHEQIRLLLHWAGGVHTQLIVPSNARGRHGRATDRAVVDLVRELVHVSPDPSIAQILNRLGYRTGRDNTWTEARVRALRSYHDIPHFDRGADRAWLTMQEAAAQLGVSTPVVRRLIRDGTLPGRQVVRNAPWVIEREALALACVQEAVRAVHEGRRLPRTDPAQTQIPWKSTT